MDQIVLFVLLGLAPGALIAAMALGVVLAYRGAGVINMATGVIAVWGAYVFYGLRTEGSLFLPPLPFCPHFFNFGAPWGMVPALLVAILYCAVLGLLFEVLVLRPLRTSSPLAKLLASLGVFLTLQAILQMRFGSDGQTAPSVLPNGPDDVVAIFGVNVPSDRFILTGIVIAVTVALMALYRFTRFGLATRAAAENETNATLFGLSPNRLSLINILLAFVLVGALGVLVAPVTTLDPITIPNTIVPALGAALLARFTSFGIAAAAGIAMGVLQSLVVYAQTKSWFPTTNGGEPLPGVSDLLFFVIIVAAMYWRGASLPTRGMLSERRLPAAPAARRMALPATVGVLGCVIFFLVVPFDWRQAGTNSLIGVIVCLSLVVITGFIGQTSLVQVGLAGVAGFVLSKLAVHAGLGFPLGALIAIAAATAMGVLVAASALRVRGVNLAIVTLAAMVALENFGFANSTWGGGPSGSPVPDPHLGPVNLGNTASFPINGGSLPSPVFGFVCIAVVLITCLIVASLRRGGLGQRMLAVRSNERAAAAAGIDVGRTKLLAFALSSALAGTAGVLYAYNFGSVTGARFGLFISLTFIAFAYIGGITTVQGALLAGLGVTEGILNLVLNDKIGIPVEYQFLLGGLALVVIIITKPEGLASNKGMTPPHLVLYRWVTGRGATAAPTAEVTK